MSMPRLWAWLLLNTASLASVFSQQPQGNSCDAAGPRIDCGESGFLSTAHDSALPTAEHGTIAGQATMG